MGEELIRPLARVTDPVGSHAGNKGWSWMAIGAAIGTGIAIAAAIAFPPAGLLMIAGTVLGSVSTITAGAAIGAKYGKTLKTEEDGAPCSQIILGSTKTRCEGIDVARMLDKNAHGGAAVLKTGAAKVYEGGQPISRVGESSTCGAMKVLKGAAKTFVGGPSVDSGLPVKDPNDATLDWWIEKLDMTSKVTGILALPFGLLGAIRSGASAGLKRAAEKGAQSVLQRELAAIPAQGLSFAERAAAQRLATQAAINTLGRDAATKAATWGAVRGTGAFALEQGGFMAAEHYGSPMAVNYLVQNGYMDQTHAELAAETFFTVAPNLHQLRLPGKNTRAQWGEAFSSSFGNGKTRSDNIFGPQFSRPGATSVDPGGGGGGGGPSGGGGGPSGGGNGPTGGGGNGPTGGGGNGPTGGGEGGGRGTGGPEGGSTRTPANDNTPRAANDNRAPDPRAANDNRAPGSNDTVPRAANDNRAPTDGETRRAANDNEPPRRSSDEETRRADDAETRRDTDDAETRRAAEDADGPAPANDNEAGGGRPDPAAEAAGPPAPECTTCGKPADKPADGFADTVPAAAADTVTPGHGLSEAKIAEIQRLHKNDRPNPQEYLSREYIAQHLEQFKDGAVRLQMESGLNKYGPSREDGTSFVMPKAEADALLAKYAGDPAGLEGALGLPKGTLSKPGDRLLYVEVKNPESLGLRMPSGGEAGANEKWIPGGKLPEGGSEAIVDLGGVTEGTGWRRWNVDPNTGAVTDNHTGLSKQKFDEIVAAGRFNRPEPGEYLSQSYIDNHLAKFDDGAVRLQLESKLNAYGPSNTDTFSFVMPKAEADALLAKTPAEIETTLGLPPGSMSSSTDRLMYVEIANPRDAGLAMPSGNEKSTWDAYWLPGGKLPTGGNEAIVSITKADEGIKWTARPVVVGPKPPAGP